MPDSLFDIVSKQEKRKKLVMYINPPYKRGLGVANTNWNKNELGESKDELYIQFLYRIYIEIPNSIIGVFSKLKMLNAPDFLKMRELFLAKLERMFVVPADTFDNVKGKFPIGFQIYNSNLVEKFKYVKADVYDINSSFLELKGFSIYDDAKFLNKWLINFKDKNIPVGKLIFNSNDFQHQNRIRIVNPDQVVLGGDGKFLITNKNLLIVSIYLTVRQCIKATWLNDRDQFLFPNYGWNTDFEFQYDCFAFALFDGQNRISINEGTNHWIPFTEHEVNAKAKFESNFMTDFIKGEIKKEISNDTLFKDEEIVESKPLVFSDEATAVFDAGRELWKYYHAQNDVDINENASFYDIRAYFQGTNALGRMNARSEDATYTKLIGELRNNLSVLADKIKPKVYEYEFLKE